MSKNRLKKTKKGKYGITKHESAYEEMERGNSSRSFAELHGVNRMSSLQYIRKYDGASTDYNENRGSLRYVARNKVFNDDQDEQMSKYVICCAKIYFGLFPKEIQKWVSELATQ